MKVQTQVKAGLKMMNHNQTLVRGSRIVTNHNQTVVRRLVLALALLCCATQAMAAGSAPGCTGAVPPPTPSALHVLSEKCLGLNSLSWTPSCNATTYRLYKLNTNSTNLTLVYSGPATTYDVNVSTTTYFRVRACNAHGCSDDRAGDKPALKIQTCKDN